ncbi:MAG: YbhB/YbcL family Raf kinase inhibitor-like protein [Nitrosopumilus sp.]
MSNFVLESNAFENGGEIPRKYGYKNGNNSPPLKISDIPENTSSLALIMDDPDAMGAVGKVWVHWVLWNIDPNTTKFEENSIPADCFEGKTDFGEIGYGGPAPPDKEHTYIFKLYALDKKLDVDKGSTKKQIEETMKNHIIAETRLEGRYSP